MPRFSEYSAGSEISPRLIDNISYLLDKFITGVISTIEGIGVLAT